MACNTVEVLERRPDGKFNSLGWAGVSCRTETDWYVTLGNKIVVDHLPSWESAKAELHAFVDRKAKQH